MSVNLTIHNCGECPHRRSERFFTADAFEFVQQWWCGKSNRPKPETTDAMKAVPNSSRIGFEETGSSPKNIPAWCPLI